ncbi:MAG: thiol:disulfide interchange protein DsbD [Phenylobacterium sp.]|jgi:thiol:disulfide interchange protein DsbD
MKFINLSVKQTLTSVWLLVMLSLTISPQAIAAADFLNSTLDTPVTALEDMVPSEEEPEFLPVDQAFEFEFEQEGNNLILTWQIADEYYLYRDKIKFAATGASVGEVALPDSKTIEDEYFGTSHIYRQQLTLIVPLSDITEGSELKVRYQGCADAGLCYPPTKKVMPIILAKTTGSSNANSAEQSNNATIQVSQQNELASDLASGGLFFTLLAFFGLGLGLAFTPCVFPMYPILSGIIAGQGNKLTTRNGFMLSMAYVQGMALTYAALGLVVASAGVKFQAYFQHPAVLISLSLLFVLLSLSMFGWFDIGLPQSWQAKVTKLSNKQKGGSFGGVFMMGALSGLIASPCTTAPLSGALLYVAKSGDLVLGGITLYILSLGMGLPLLILGASGGKLLPKAGAWMDSIKTVFGFLLLAVPLILLDRLIDISYTLTAAAILSFTLCAYLYYIHQQLQSPKAKTAVWFIAMSLFFLSATTLHQLWFAPSQSSQQGSAVVVKEQHGGFIDITSLAELNEQLTIAKTLNKPVMIDLYADWCVACKEFEQYTFTDPTVKAQMENFILLRADVTANNDTDLELLEHYSILGLPSLLFFNRQSEEMDQQRVTGFMAAENFNQHLIRVLKL